MGYKTTRYFRSVGRLVGYARDQLAHNDGWFALAVLCVVFVPIVALLFY